MSVSDALPWIGYTTGGARSQVTLGALGERALVLGRGAVSLAGLVLAAWREAGKKALVLDLEGSCFGPATHDFRALLYDAFELDPDDPAHGQLAGAAYACALGLPPDEEALICAAMHSLCERGDAASPSAVYDALKGVPDFRGPYVDRLKGRLGALRHLEAVQGETFSEELAGGGVVRFTSALYPLSADVAAGLFLAKGLRMAARRGSFDALMVTAAHRLFWERPGSPRCRFLSEALETGAQLFLCSPHPSLLCSKVLDSFPVRAYSSEAWNSQKEWRQGAALPGTFTVCDDRSGMTFSFVPRYHRGGAGEGVRVSVPVAAAPPPSLTMAILEEAERFGLANRESIASFLSSRFLEGDVTAEVDRLLRAGALVVEAKRRGREGSVLALSLTEAGRELLSELGR
jgi:hypothetical protein